MRRKAIAGVACATLLCAGISAAADKSDPGKSEYDAYCAVCHGVTGEGNGPYRPALVNPPTDLTQLTKKNGGVYPYNHVYQVIDGRILVAGHGPSDMPIWGDRYLARAAEHYVDVPYEPERYVRGRILAIAEYVSRLQAK